MLQNIGLPGLLLIAVVVLVLFGRGKVSSLMGEVGKGINAFKKGVKEEDEEIASATRVEKVTPVIESRPADVTPATEAEIRAAEARDPAFAANKTTPR